MKEGTKVTVNEGRSRIEVDEKAVVLECQKDVTEVERQRIVQLIQSM